MNNLGFFKVLGLMTAALVFAALALQATAAEAETLTVKGSREIQWIWSGTSADINKATAALASGHIKRGLRLTTDAQASLAQASDRLIAIHNLCLAQLAQGAIVAADTPCRTALLSTNDARVLWQRGGFITVSDTAAHTETPPTLLAAVVRANVAFAYGEAVVGNLARTTEAALW
jgi:hypothetical protein